MTDFPLHMKLEESKHQISADIFFVIYNVNHAQRVTKAKDLESSCCNMNKRDCTSLNYTIHFPTVLVPVGSYSISREKMIKRPPYCSIPSTQQGVTPQRHTHRFKVQPKTHICPLQKSAK